jgi:hypothetical protein
MNARTIAVRLKETLDQGEYFEGWWEDFNSIPPEYLPHAFWLVAKELMYLQVIDIVDVVEPLDIIEENEQKEESIEIE